MNMNLNMNMNMNLTIMNESPIGNIMEGINAPQLSPDETNEIKTKI